MTRTAADKLSYTGAFLLIMGGALWFKGPAVNTGQTLFRLSVSVVGLLLMGTAYVMRK